MTLIRDYIDGQFKNESEGDVGIAGFTTVARVSDNVSQTREVPTTYLEDGSHVNDHIIHKPIIIKIEGNISDVHEKPSPALAALRELESSYGEIAAYLPTRTQAQISKVAGITADIQQRIDQVDAAIGKAQSIADKVGYTGPGSREQGKTNIEKFFDHIDGLLESETLIKIDGPVRTYHNMCITAFEYGQDNRSEAIDFTIEAQELRFAETIFSETAPSPDPATNGQHSSEVDKGAQTGEEVETSIALKYGNKIKSYFTND